MKYVILCLVMLCCFAIAGANSSTESQRGVGESADVIADQVDDEMVAASGSCGGNTCRKGTFCCNASCGICAPNGGGCTQQAC
mgnify:CR=1 FL=1